MKNTLKQTFTIKEVYFEKSNRALNSGLERKTNIFFSEILEKKFALCVCGEYVKRAKKEPN
jgi:hypothetical protein